MVITSAISRHPSTLTEELMLDAKVLETELAALQAKRLQLVAAVQQADGAIGMCKHLLKKCVEGEQREPFNRLPSVNGEAVPAVG